jgi:serine phosphatase RsbU (regulator of sigma subunit)
VQGRDGVDGPRAAAAMGQLRSVLRSYAYEGSSPSVVLDRLDRLVQDFQMAEVATAIYGRLILDHGIGLLLYSNAGHVPPLVRDRDGVHRLDGGSHHLIGVISPGQQPRGEAGVPLAPGSTLLLYTDGLVETRARPFDEGIDDLVRALAALAPNSSPEDICDALLEAMVTPQPEDDVAVLTLRLNDDA